MAMIIFSYLIVEEDVYVVVFFIIKKLSKKRNIGILILSIKFKYLYFSRVILSHQDTWNFE